MLELWNCSKLQKYEFWKNRYLSTFVSLASIWTMTINVTFLAFIVQILRMIAINTEGLNSIHKIEKNQCKNMKFELLESGFDISIYCLLITCIIVSLVNVACYILHVLPSFLKKKSQSGNSIAEGTPMMQLSNTDDSRETIAQAPIQMN